MRVQILGKGAAALLLGGGGLWAAWADGAMSAVAAPSARPVRSSQAPTARTRSAAPSASVTPPKGPDDACSVECKDASACSDKEGCLLGCCVPKHRAEQESPVTRSGHEHLTSLSVRAALAQNPSILGAKGAPDLPGPTGCSVYRCAHGARKVATFSAIMGVRWADLMGFRAGPTFPAQQRCLSAVAQDNEEVQYDHALRRRDDAGPQGGVRAISGIRQRLLERFVEAATANDDMIEIADGGGAQDHFKVVKSFFLLGRALHIVQDSFSTYHMKRQAPAYTDIVQVNSYVCTPGAPPHPHETPGVLNLVDVDARSPNGDIVRQVGCVPETPKGDAISCLKPEYVKSVDASRDLWLAFAKARTTPTAQRKRAAEQAVLPLLDRWFKVPVSVPAATAPTTCDVESVAAIDARRRACLRMTGAGRGLEAPYSWRRFLFTDIP
jgi:hypothetical protein